MRKERTNWNLLLNQKFNKLTITELLGHNSKGKKLCVAECDCGVVKPYIAGNIKSNIAKSCGNCPTENLIGKKIGPYTVTKFLGLKKFTKYSQFFWEVACNYGHFKMYTSNDLKKVRHSTCLVCKKLENAVKWYYSRYRYEAKVKDRKFEISLATFIEITKSPCAYCNSAPDFIRIKGSTPLKLNGVDRINSDYGYIKHNVVPCCKICNRMKMVLSKKDFINHIDKIHQYNFHWNNQDLLLTEIKS